MFANCLPYIFERTPYQSTKQQVPYFQLYIAFPLVSCTPITRNLDPSPGYITHNLGHPSSGLYNPDWGLSSRVYNPDLSSLPCRAHTFAQPNDT